MRDGRVEAFGKRDEVIARLQKPAADGNVKAAVRGTTRSGEAVNQ
jgi:hypothetical protein